MVFEAATDSCCSYFKDHSDTGEGFSSTTFVSRWIAESRRSLGPRVVAYTTPVLLHQQSFLTKDNVFAIERPMSGLCISLSEDIIVNVVQTM